MDEGSAMTDIEILSVVALLDDLPVEGLVCGQVGTVVESRAPGVYEVEFCDGDGIMLPAELGREDSRSYYFGAVQPLTCAA
jgi:hypothetical protein